MPPRDAAATRERIAAAAVIEFAASGLAGARVDRIAERAECNKQLIYAYFSSKEKLFDHVAAQATTVELDPADLPGYAQRVFDANRERPELARLARWHALERPGQAVDDEAVSAIAAAQKAKTIDDALPPEQLLALVHAIANAEPEGSGKARRKAIGEAVRRLTEPSSGGHHKGKKKN